MSTAASVRPISISRNISSALGERARTDPTRAAVIIPGAGEGSPGRTWSFQELEERSAALAAGLQSIGLERGARVVLMVPPSIDFFALIFALFRAGVVPVVVDPGMGLKSLKRCLGEARPEAFIGIPKAQAARFVLGWARETLRTIITTGSFRAGRGFTLRETARRGASRPLTAPVELEEGEPAAILFTSGSTGPPKGVVYTHAVFAAQVDSLRATYGIEPGEVDLCTFPLFALFAPALGMTAVVPPMDPSRPARADPRRVLAVARDFAATNFFGSPALIRSFGRWGAETGFRLPDLRRAISAGAPVPASAIERFLLLLPEGAHVHTPYGATEALPVASIRSDEILGETRALADQGRGICVGRPAGGIEAVVIRITDSPIDSWSDDLRAPPGAVGEIAVRGPVVTREYFARLDATRLAKIPGPDGSIFHRMGDLGWRDECGRLWFCGRKSERVVLGGAREGETLFTIPCEAVFNVHPAVRRTALVGVRLGGEVEPAICVETERRLGRRERGQLRSDLEAIALRHPHTQRIRRFLFHPGFPVDVRHNAKIGRAKLARWAARRIPGAEISSDGRTS